MSLNTLLQARKTALETSIPIYEAAIDALGNGNAQSYTLDTGQSRQTVTRLDLVGLQKVLDSMLNRYAVICARLTGSGTVIGRPQW